MNDAQGQFSQAKHPETGEVIGKVVCTKCGKVLMQSADMRWEAIEFELAAAHMYDC